MSLSIVIFGASGDLTRRKLVPALFNLHRKDRLPDNFRIIGFAKTEWDEHRFRKILYDGVREFADYRWDAPGRWTAALHVRTRQLGAS